MHEFNGYEVVIVEPKTVRLFRGWAERVFSRPWRPWRSWRDQLVEPPLPRGLFLIQGNTLLIRREDYERLRAGHAATARPMAAGPGTN